MCAKTVQRNTALNPTRVPRPSFCGPLARTGYCNLALLEGAKRSGGVSSSQAEGIGAVVMTQLLEKALREVEKLPPSEQDAVAAIVLEELASEKKWAELFAKSQDALAKMAEEALAEHRAGKTKPL